MKAAELFRQLVRGIRKETPLQGTTEQLAELIACGMDIISPESTAAELDASILALQFRYMSQELAVASGGNTDYPEDDDDED